MSILIFGIQAACRGKLVARVVSRRSALKCSNFTQQYSCLLAYAYTYTCAYILALYSKYYYDCHLHCMYALIFNF